jgi:hypothetical protein
MAFRRPDLDRNVNRFPKTLPVSAVVFSHPNRGALDVRNYLPAWAP